MTEQQLCPTCNFPLQAGQSECPNCGTILDQQLVQEIMPTVDSINAPAPRKKTSHRKSGTGRREKPRQEVFYQLLDAAYEHELSNHLEEALQVYRQAKNVAGEGEGGMSGIKSLVPLLEQKIWQLEGAQKQSTEEEQDDLTELAAAARAFETAERHNLHQEDVEPVEKAPKTAQEKLSPLLLSSLIGWLERGPEESDERQVILASMLDSDRVLPATIQVENSAEIQRRQEATHKHSTGQASQKFGWQKFLYWVAINAVGIALVITVGSLLDFYYYRAYSWFTVFLAFCAPGLVLGSLQWLVLKDYLHKGWAWIAISTAGTALVYSIVTAITGGNALEGLIWSAAVTGLLISTGQYYFHLRRIRYAESWILLSTLGWLFAGLTTTDTHILWATLVGFPILGILTGIALYLKYGKLDSLTGTSAQPADSNRPKQYSSTIMFFPPQVKPKKRESLGSTLGTLKHDFVEFFSNDTVIIGSTIFVVIVGIAMCCVVLALVVAF